MSNRYFIDTEFIEDGHSIELISIGVVASDGRTYYAVSSEFSIMRLFHNQWLVENVLPHLPITRYNDRLPWTPNNVQYLTHDPAWRTRHQIRDDLLEFVRLSVPSPDPGETDTIVTPDFWGYYSDYDWVAICQLFGKMIDLPSGWPKYCLDLKQLAKTLGIDRYPQPALDAEHNALADARWNAAMFTYAQSIFACRSDEANAGVLENFLGL